MTNLSPPGATPSLAVVMGASAGGVEALLRVAADLPQDFAGIVCMVLHVGSHPSILPELLSTRAGRPAVHPKDGQRAAPGTIYVAPPDHHMLLHRDVLRLSHAPRENLARPAIDPLFRSAALHWRSRAVGVVLSGRLDDGAAGLAAIKAAGGVTIVQGPADAAEPEMPMSALAAARVVDACLPVADIAPYLQRLAQAAPPHADTSPYGGSPREVRGDRPLRDRRRTGHAFRAARLADGQGPPENQHLRGRLRALRERAVLLRRMVTVARGTADAKQAAIVQAQAEHVERQAAELEAMLQEQGSGPAGSA